MTLLHSRTGWLVALFLVGMVLVGTTASAVALTGPAGGTVAGRLSTTGPPVPASPGVNPSNATFDGSEPGNVTVAYNVSTYVDSGAVQPEDLAMHVSAANVTRFIDLSSASGRVNVTLPVDAWGGGEHNYTVSIFNESAIRNGSFATGHGSVSVRSNVSVTSYDVRDTSVDVGEQVAVDVTLHNDGTTDERFTVALYGGTNGWYVLSGADADTVRTVTLEPGATRNVTLTFSRSFPLNVTLNPNGAPATTVVIRNDTTDAPTTEPANVTVAGASVVTDRVFVGDAVTVEATLTNQESREVNYTVRASATGQTTLESTTGSKAVTLAAGETRTVTLNFTLPVADKYWVNVGSVDAGVAWGLESGTTIRLANVYDSIDVTVGESAIIPATALNVGTANGSKTLTVSKGGEVLATKTVTVPSGSAQAADFAVTFNESGTYQVSVGSHTVNVSAREPVVSSARVRHISGPAPAGNVTVDAGLEAGMVGVQLATEYGNRDLSTSNVTTESVFRITLVLNNYSAPLLIGQAHNTSWERTAINDTHTRVTITTSPAEWQFVEGARLHDWPTGSDDRATQSAAAVVDLSLDPMDHYAGSDRRQTLAGAVIVTDAQTWGTPQFQAGGPQSQPELSILVAGPHYEVDGSVNDGFYEAYLPPSLLDSWNVSSPSELRAAYQDGSANLSARETADGGIYVEIPVHYSAGTVVVKPDNETTDTPQPTNPVAEYAGSDGAMSTTDLRSMISAWVRGKVNTDALRQGIQDWVMSG